MSRETRLYVMLKPPPAARAELCRCRGAHGLDDSYAAGKLHCTLLRLGEGGAWAQAERKRLRAVLGTVVAEPFPVAFDALDGNLLRGRKGMGGAAAFHRALRRRVAAAGFALPEHDFWLHLSLAYEGGIARRVRIAPIGWLVEEFRLVLSVHGMGHEELGRWPLARRQGELFQ